MQFFFSPFWGRLSDKYGRRPVFIVGLSGYAICMLLFGIGNNLPFLYLARILGGTFSAAVLPVANAYVSDSTSDKDRSHGMAVLGGAIGLGVVAGPVLGGFLSRRDIVLPILSVNFTLDHFKIPFFVAALLSVLSVVAAILWLPESLGKTFGTSHCRSFVEKAVANMGKLQRTIPTRLWPLLTIAFLNQFALATFEGTFSLHAIQENKLTPSEVVLIFFICGVVMAVAQPTIVVWLIKQSGEWTLIPVGFTLMAISLGLLMNAQNLAILLIYVALFAMGVAMIIPCVSALVSLHAGTRQGIVLGQLTAFISLGQASGPMIGGLLFALNVHVSYLATSILLMLAGVYLLQRNFRKT